MMETCDGKSGPGVTHHNACECRERYFGGLIRELEAARGIILKVKNEIGFNLSACVSADLYLKIFDFIEALQSPKEPNK